MPTTNIQQFTAFCRLHVKLCSTVRMCANTWTVLSAEAGANSCHKTKFYHSQLRSQPTLWVTWHRLHSNSYFGIFNPTFRFSNKGNLSYVGVNCGQGQEAQIHVSFSGHSARKNNCQDNTKPFLEKKNYNIELCWPVRQPQANMGTWNTAGPN